MRAVILAGGEGKRMYPLTQTRPKVMLPVANKPILEWILLQGKSSGISEFFIVVGYKSEFIEKYFGDGSSLGISIKYLKQKEPLGTAHALSLARKWMNSKFLVMNGDVYFHFDLRKLIREENLLIVKEMEDPSGSAVIIPEGNKVAKLVEKPPHPESNLASSGIFVLPPDIFDAVDEIGLSSRGEYELPSAIQILIDRGMELKYIHGEWTDVGYPWDLLTMNEVLLRRMEGSVEGKVEERATIHGPVIVGEGSIIRNGSYLIGPVVIGKECDIGPNCFIRPYTSIGNKVRIGNGVEVKNSIIMDNTNIGHLSYVGDSIIGYNCNFGAGTIVANLRLDEKEVKVISKGEVYPTRRRKLGTIMGDNVHTGIGCLLNTGSIIPANSKLMPGEWVGGEYVEVR